MRNRFLLLPLLTVLSATAVAQPTTSKNNFSKYTIDALKSGNSQNKTTGAMERVSATATYSINMGGGLPSLELNDSTKYKYSNGRGSSFDPAQLEGLDGDVSEFILFDSSWNYTDNGSGMDLNEIAAITYNTGNKRSSVVKHNKQNGVLTADEDIRYEYNTDGNVSVKHELYWDKTKNSWDSVRRTYYDYNAQKKLQQERVYDAVNKVWESRISFTYNTSGKADTILTENYTTVWSPASREIHVFTAGKLSTSLSQIFENASWKNQRIDSFGYTAGADFHTFSQGKNWDTATAAWVNSNQQVRTLNAQKLIETEAIKSWDTAAKTWGTDAELKWFYDAGKKPIRLDMTTPLLPLPIPVTRVHMYYETYFPAGVAQVNTNVEVKMYPNPATDKVNISFDKETASAVVLVTNMAGQVVSNSTRRAVNGALEVSLQGLQAGVYNLSIQFADGTLSSQRIIKQ